MVSVIIRTINRESLLRRALASLAQQTYRNIELILVNDSNQIISEDLCMLMDQSVPQWKIISNSGVHGRAYAANLGLESVSGKYVLFLDEDDWLYENHLEKLISYLDEHPTCNVVYTGIELRDHNENVVNVMDEEWDANRFRGMNYIPIHAVAFRHEPFAYLRFDTSLELMEDWDFWLQMVQQHDFHHIAGVSGVYELGSGESGLSQGREINTVKKAHSNVLTKWMNIQGSEGISDSLFWFDTAMNYYKTELHRYEHEFKDLYHFRGEIEKLHREYHRLDEEFSRVTSAYNDTLQALDNVRSTLTESENKLLETEKRYQSLHEEYHSVLESESWKITAPLRFIGRIGRFAPLGIHALRYLIKNPHILSSVFRELRYSGLRTTLRKIQHKSEKIENFIASQEQSIVLDSIRSLFHTKPVIPEFACPKAIDIIIPVYNGKEYLEPLFNSIIKHSTLPFRLIVADDKSSDPEVLPLLHHIRKRHPQIDMVILENKHNLGFIKTVNKLSSLCENHFVLLNTDTEVPPYWLERLMYPIFMIDGVASTTPFTNAGTICSFPNYLEDNPIFGGFSVEEVDQAFQYVNFHNTYITVPTGVGFCMGMNKNVVDTIGMFDEIYGKGYSEENDWCQRAILHGYKHIHVTNLFVYHKHGGSFSSEEKQKLQRDNLQTLLSRYPSYSEQVHSVVQADHLKPLREQLAKQILRTHAERKLHPTLSEGRSDITLYYIGHLSAFSGVGRASEGYIRVLKSLGFTLKLYDLAEIGWVERLAHEIVIDLPSFVIYHFNANELITLDKRFLEQIRALSYTIGIWAWESNHPHEDFKRGSEYLDEIWAISEYMREALMECSSRVNVVPHIIDEIEAPIIQINPTLSEIRRTHTFIAGYMFDLNSYEFRKNPMGVIEAFQQAFEKEESCALILKISGRKHHPEVFDAIVKSVVSMSNIYIIDAYWSDGEIGYFYQCLDVYLALFRAEGFGLTIAEAMAHGVPVVCTRYSGVVDFIGNSVKGIDYRWIEIPTNWGPYKKGWEWADPDVALAAKALRELYDNPEERNYYSDQGKEQIRKCLSVETIGKVILNVLIESLDSKRDIF